MAHQSENARRLVIRKTGSIHSPLPSGGEGPGVRGPVAHRQAKNSLQRKPLTPTPLPQGERGFQPHVCFIIFPFRERSEFARALLELAKSIADGSVLAILCHPAHAVDIVSTLGGVLKPQLWVAVKLAEPITIKGHLPQQHAALLVFSQYQSALKHTKTRIAYSYCPACDRTTKDYGGKKHTYHEYGTLLSDVWRDISFAPGGEPAEIIDRLADLFGVAPYEELRVIDLQDESARFRGAKGEGENGTECSPLTPSPSPPRGEGRKGGRGEQVSAPLPSGERGAKRRAIELDSRLINGDCLAELAKLPDCAVDFCFADPPYNLAKRYDKWDDGIDMQDYFAWCDQWLDELARVLRPGCTCAILNIPFWAARHFSHLSKKLDFQSWIAWEGLSLPVRMIMPAHYAIICFSKGRPRPLPGLAAVTTLKEDYCIRGSCRRPPGIDQQPVGDLWWDIHRLKHNSRRVDHPCQLPPALMNRLIRLFTNENELVLDPFDGAGTTSLCAEMLGRRYIGIELSASYHELAKTRHAGLSRGEDPFAKARRIPTAKNSRVERIGGQRYKVSKKRLQLEVKRIAKELGRMPSRDDLERHCQYPVKYYDQYFISWGEVCAAARTTGMQERRIVL